MALCQSEEIIFTKEKTVVGRGNYQEYHDAINEVALNYGIEFYDFNLIREGYLDTADYSLFMDVDHLNYHGANRFTEVFCKVMNKEYATRDVFYNSYDEKVDRLGTVVYGLACKNYDEVETERQACVVTTKPADIEYRLIIKTKSGDEYTIDDIGENESFTLPAGYGEVDIIWYGATPATSENIVDCYF